MWNREAFMSCTAAPWDELTEVAEESVELSPENPSDMLPPTIESLEVMAEAGVFVPMGIAWEMSGTGIVSL
jgi:hypothetical protein